MLQITHSSQNRQQFAFSPSRIGGNHELQEDYREINGCSNRSLTSIRRTAGWAIDKTVLSVIQTQTKVPGVLKNRKTARIVDILPGLTG